MARKVLILAAAFDRAPAPAGSGFAKAFEMLEAGGFELVRLPRKNADNYTPADLAGNMAGVEAVIAGSERWDDAMFGVCPDVKIVARYGVGYDAVDLAAATRHGVMVTNTRSELLSEAVAEAALAYMLGCLRNMPAMHCDMKAGVWKMRSGRSLSGKTVGLIGFGGIGQCLAKLLAPFGGARLAYSPSVPQAVAAPFGVRMAGLDEVLAESDVVSVQAPNVPKNRHIINASTLSKMKRGAVLVNVARGSLVDEGALYSALVSGQLSAAGLDVWDEEPVAAGNPLLGLENVFAQPHMGGATAESAAAIAGCDVRQVIDALGGRVPEFVLNP